MADSPIAAEGALNGVTPVTVLAAPAINRQRIIPANGLAVYNADTAPVTIIFQKDKGGVKSVFWQVTAASGAHVVLAKKIILDAANESVEIKLAAGVATNQPTYDVAALETAEVPGTAITDIVDLPTAELDATKVLKPDGLGGVAWGVDAGGGGGALDDLTDVAAPAPNDGDVLTYDAGTTSWVPAAPAAGAAALDDLTDVTAPAPNDNEILTYNAGLAKWVAATPGAPGAHVLTHEIGGADAILTENLSTTEMDGTKVLKPSGAGGVVWGAASAPGAHATTHQNGGADEISVAGLSGLLADGQTPLTHAASHQNGGTDEISVTGLSGLLADGQTPLAHAASHVAGGSDSIKLDDLAAPDDNTDLDVTIVKHGLAPKAPNDATKFLNGTGAWSVPAGASTLDALTDVSVPAPANSDVLAFNSGTGLWQATPASAPGAHAATHLSGGVDSIKLDDLAAPDDNTDLNASAVNHGLCPKLSNNAAQYLNGTGGWTTPAGGAGGSIQRLAMINPPAGTSTWPLLKVPGTYTLSRVRSIMIGTGSGSADVTVNGTEQLTPDQTLNTSWQDSGALAVGLVSGDELSVVLKNISGTVSYVVVQVELS